MSYISHQMKFKIPYTQQNKNVECIFSLLFRPTVAKISLSLKLRIVHNFFKIPPLNPNISEKTCFLDFQRNWATCIVGTLSDLSLEVIFDPSDFFENCQKFTLHISCHCILQNYHTEILRTILETRSS